VPADDLPRCARCHAALGACEASITGDVFGDACTDSYFPCPACGAYTLELLRDRFLGEDESRFSTLGHDEARRRIALVARCPDPSDKRCRCPAHVEYFG
jgi:hypothetical protein